MNKAVTIKERNSNIELLRIISMSMVLVLHCLSASGALDYLSGINYWVYWWMEAACIIAVNVFVLISGYFMVESSFKVSRVLKIWGGVWIYSLLFSVVDFVVSGQTLSAGYLVRMLFPLLTKRYWFVNSYLLLYLLSPFLNKLIRSLSKKHFELLLFYLLLLFSVRVTVLPLTWSQDPSSGMGIIWFIVLYCVAAWVRLYYKQNGKWQKWLIIYLAMSALLVVSKKAMLWVGFDEAFTSKLYGYASVFVLMEAVAFFLFFLNVKPIMGRAGKWINNIAKHSFSAYIIHFTITGVLWTRILHMDMWIDDAFSGMIAVLLATVGVFVICVIIDSLKDMIVTCVGENIKVSGKLACLLNKWERLGNL